MAVAVALTASACSGGATVEVDVPAQVEGGFTDEIQQELQAAAEQAMAASGATGAIVGVWAPWSGSWVAGLGTTGPDGAAVSEDMTFRASRVTRAMTCDVLYVLDEKGTVSLDDSVTDYVTGVPDLEAVTLEMLCDGTSGVGSYEPYLKADWLEFPGREWDPAFLASFGLSDRSDAEPGATFRESDAGYVLLGQALENATRMSASDLIAEYVTEPLELTSTELPGAAPAEPGANPLPGYQSLRGEEGLNCAEPTDYTESSSSIGFTDSGVTSSIQDLGRYAQALATGALLPEDTERFDDAKPAYGDAPSWQTTAGGARITGSSDLVLRSRHRPDRRPRAEQLRRRRGVPRIPRVGARRDRVEGARCFRPGGTDRGAAVDGGAVPRADRRSRDLSDTRRRRLTPR